VHLSILFVDDEPNVLDGLRRMLRSLRGEWSAEFAGGGMQALAMMETKSFDVIVTDMRMPGMTGVQLLEEVIGRYPKTIRIILSGQCDEQASARAVRVAHQMLSKPCHPETLKATVASAFAQNELLSNETLMSLVTRQDTVPSLPSLYADVVAELDSSEPSLEKVAGIVARDPGMAAKILHLANSSFFGVRNPSSNPRQAVTLLGLETMRMLVLTVSIFSRFKPADDGLISMETVWAHSRATGALAARIAKSEGADANTVDHAAAAGLLHDIGKLILMNSLPDAYHDVLLQARTAHIPFWQVEQAALGASHAEVGACLLRLWGVPAPIIEAVAWHHRPNDCPNPCFRPLTAVHAANALLHGSRSQTDAVLDLDYLKRLNIADRMQRWQDLCNSQMAEDQKP
jgi:putative nucleotidyltransferase with HDIG domain